MPMRVAEPFKLMNSVSLAANAVSAAQDVSWRKGYSITAAWTGTVPVGVLKLQVTNAPADVATDADWVDVAGSSVTVNGTNTPGNYGWNFVDAYYARVRLVWTSSSGIGTLSAWFCAKD